ncbi:hypothetical protein KCU76_g20, partial [Aureobasidium melanogenum]
MEKVFGIDFFGLQSRAMDVCRYMLKLTYYLFVQIRHTLQELCYDRRGSFGTQGRNQTEILPSCGSSWKSRMQTTISISRLDVDLDSMASSSVREAATQDQTRR